MFLRTTPLLMCNPETRRIKMPKPNYKRAEKRILALLETEPEPTNDTSKSSGSTKGIQDITQKSSETAYQFTDFDLTVFKDEPADDDDAEKDK